MADVLRQKKNAELGQLFPEGQKGNNIVLDPSQPSMGCSFKVFPLHWSRL